MKVVAVDPGYDRLGVAVLERAEGAERLIYSTCIETDKNDTLSERIAHLGEAYRDILTVHQPDVVGIETIFFNKNVKTAIGVAQARGVIVFLSKQLGAEVCEYGPQEIKIAVTGYGNSDKAAVLAMLRHLLPDLPPKALDDEYDAIAVGITTLAHHQNY